MEENFKNCSNLQPETSCVTEGPGSDLEFYNKSDLEPDFENKYGIKVETKSFNSINFKVYPILGMMSGNSYETENKGQIYRFDIFGGYQEEISYRILSTFKFIDNKTEDEFCGGIAGIPCSEGYTCKLDGSYPDAGGVCVKNN